MTNVFQTYSGLEGGPGSSLTENERQQVRKTRMDLTNELNKWRKKINGKLFNVYYRFFVGYTVYMEMNTEKTKQVEMRDNTVVPGFSPIFNNQYANLVDPGNKNSSHVGGSAIGYTYRSEFAGIYLSCPILIRLKQMLKLYVARSLILKTGT